MPRKKLKLNYPSYSARRYGIVVKNNSHNLPVLDPATFFMAKAYLMHRDTLAKTIDEVHSAIKNDKKHPYHFLAKEYTAEQLATEIEKGVKRKHGTKKLWRNSGVEVVKSANATLNVLSGKIAPYDKKKDPKNVHIDGYATSGRDLSDLPLSSMLTNIETGSADATFTAEKPSFDSWRRQTQRQYHIMDVPAAALLQYAHSKPSKVRNLEHALNHTIANGSHDIWMPFKTEGAEPSKFTPKENSDHILVETLFDYYVRGRTKKEKEKKRHQMNQVDIAKRLFSLDIIYSDRLVELLHSGKAAFQVIHDEMIMESNSDVDDAIKNWYWGKQGGGMRGFLRAHYKPNGLVYVKKGSKNEAIAENYQSVRKDDTFRIVYGNHPPLVMRLWPIKGHEKDVRVMLKQKGLPASQTAHPYSELYQIKKVYDDASRRFMWATYQIPQQTKLPDEMFEDMMTVAAQQGVSRKELAKRMFLHDQRLMASERGYMNTNVQMSRRVRGEF